jgi:hypothetical protein
MNCDACAKELTEEDTHESILCTSCMNAHEKLHCVRCHCATKFNKRYAQFSEAMNAEKLFFAILFATPLVLVFMSLFYLKAALMIAVGFTAIPLAFIALYIVFPVAYRFGSWVCDKLNILQDGWGIDDGPGGSVIWFIGLSPIAVPFILYYAGCLVSLIFRR